MTVKVLDNPFVHTSLDMFVGVSKTAWRHIGRWDLFVILGFAIEWGILYVISAGGFTITHYMLAVFAQLAIALIASFCDNEKVYLMKTKLPMLAIVALILALVGVLHDFAQVEANTVKVNYVLSVGSVPLMKPEDLWTLGPIPLLIIVLLKIVVEPLILTKSPTNVPVVASQPVVPPVPKPSTPEVARPVLPQPVIAETPKPVSAALPVQQALAPNIAAFDLTAAVQEWLGRWGKDPKYGPKNVSRTVTKLLSLAKSTGLSEEEIFERAREADEAMDWNTEVFFSNGANGAPYGWSVDLDAWVAEQQPGSRQGYAFSDFFQQSSPATTAGFDLSSAIAKSDLSLLVGNPQYAAENVEQIQNWLEMIGGEPEQAFQILLEAYLNKETGPAYRSAKEVLRWGNEYQWKEDVL